MEIVYKTENNTWGIGGQDNILNEGGIFSIYRHYPDEGWMPYKMMDGSLRKCFEWLVNNSIITLDEMNKQISSRS